MTSTKQIRNNSVKITIEERDQIAFFLTVQFEEMKHRHVPPLYLKELLFSLPIYILINTPFDCDKCKLYYLYTHLLSLYAYIRLESEHEELKFN